MVLGTYGWLEKFSSVGLLSVWVPVTKYKLELGRMALVAHKYFWLVQVSWLIPPPPPRGRGIRGKLILRRHH